MNLKIYGKAHIQGKSKKTGKDVDFYVVHLLMPDPNIEGMAAVQKTVNPSLIKYENIIVNQYYDIEPDFNGNIISFKPSKT